jgi:hypothetical protein
MTLKQTTSKTGERRHYLKIETAYRRISAAEFATRTAGIDTMEAVIIADLAEIHIIY